MSFSQTALHSINACAESARIENMKSEYVTDSQVVASLQSLIEATIEANHFNHSTHHTVTNIVSDELYVVNKNDRVTAIAISADEKFGEMSKGIYILSKVLSLPMDVVPRPESIKMRTIDFGPAIHKQEVSASLSFEYAEDAYPFMERDIVLTDKKRRRSVKTTYASQVIYGLFINSEYVPVYEGKGEYIPTEYVKRKIEQDFRRITSLEDVDKAVEIYEVKEHIKITSTESTYYSNYLDAVITKYPSKTWEELTKETSEITEDTTYRFTIVDDVVTDWFIPSPTGVIKIKSKVETSVKNRVKKGLYKQTYTGDLLVENTFTPIEELLELGISREYNVTNEFVNNYKVPNKQHAQEDMKLDKEAEILKLKTELEKEKQKFQLEKEKISKETTEKKATADNFSNFVKVSMGVIAVGSAVAGYMAKSASAAVAASTLGVIGTGVVIAASVVTSIGSFIGSFF